MKITNDFLMDYVDGTLDDSTRAAVEAHLSGNLEDAELVASMKMALGALHEWDAAEPVAVREDFWPRLREKLPANPQRNPLRALAARAQAWLWPSHSPLRLSTRVAAIAVVIAMAAALFSPKQATRQVQADSLSSADKMFIQQSLKRHSAYVSSQPVAPLTLPPGDGRNADGDGEDEENTDYTP